MMGENVFDVTKDLEKPWIHEQFVETLKLVGYAEEQCDGRLLMDTWRGEICVDPSEEIKITRKRSSDFTGHVRITDDDRILLGVHPKNFNTLKLKERIVFFIHEATHITVTGHGTEFWEEMMQNYGRVLAKRQQCGELYYNPGQRGQFFTRFPVYASFGQLLEDVGCNCTQQEGMEPCEIFPIIGRMYELMGEFMENDQEIQELWDKKQ